MKLKTFVETADRNW